MQYNFIIDLWKIGSKEIINNFSLSFLISIKKYKSYNKTK